MSEDIRLSTQVGDDPTIMMMNQQDTINPLNPYDSMAPPPSQSNQSEQVLAHLKVEPNGSDNEDGDNEPESNRVVRPLVQIDEDNRSLDTNQPIVQIDEENRPLVRMRKSRSNVWGFFHRLPEFHISNGRAVCLTCHTELSCKEGTTTSLRVHLKSRHPELFQKMCDLDSLKRLDCDLPGMMREVRFILDEDTLRQGVCDAWRTKLYSDVNVVCGVDGGVVKTHQLILGALSPYLKGILSNEDRFHEDLSLVLPDISSKVLSSFLNRVCSGDRGEARVDPSLAYLGFDSVDLELISKCQQVPAVKSEPDGFSNMEYELTPPEQIEDIDQASADEFYGMPDADDSFEEKKRFRKKRRTHGLRKNRSLTWEYFDRISNTTASCNTCKLVVKTEAGNTSGMAAHLRVVHPDKYREMKVSKNGRGAEESSDKEIPDVKVKDEPDESIADEPENDESDRPKRKKRSRIWKYFEQEDANTAKCLSCKASIRTEMGNTSGMANHLRGTHQKLFKEFQESKSDPSFQPTQRESQQAEVPKRRLNELTAKSSPVWQFFDDAEDEQVRCVECDKTFVRVQNSTSLLIRHLRRRHEELYETCIKDKLENPDRPDPGDTAHPIWNFFENVVASEAQDKTADIEGSTRCKDCSGLFPFPETDVVPLEEHIKSEHSTSYVAYEKQCTEWKLQRIEEASMSMAVNAGRKKTGPRTTRSAVWNYFKKTGDKTKNVCMNCGKILICNQQNTTNMIRHLECNHHALFVQFLKDSGSSEENIKGASVDRVRKRRGPKPTYSDDPIHRTCPDCQKVYSCRPAMLYHRKTVHSGVRPYKCNECGMTFSRPDSYRGHTHNKTRSYLCSLCGKTFARKNIRDQHERAHRGDKRYSCGFCGKLFMTNQQRANHERTHTGEKPFQCNECGRQFAQQHQLTTHMRIHTGEKPYSCPHCNQKFRHLSSRNNHKCETRIGGASRWAGAAQPALQQESNSLLGP